MNPSNQIHYWLWVPLLWPLQDSIQQPVAEFHPFSTNAFDTDAQGCGCIRLLWMQLFCRICHGDCDHYHDLMKTGTIRYNLHPCVKYTACIYTGGSSDISRLPQSPTAKAPSTTCKYSPPPLSKLLTPVKLLEAGRTWLRSPCPALQQTWRMDMGLWSLTPHPPCYQDQLIEKAGSRQQSWQMTNYSFSKCR